eukprot:CAMPEP_0203844454 /NCGR_PEP_ID=MMETSP0359-20131031/3206_1 /ASSEMBLY_ACC=CAM_ASM_000338 /TAXON_ID=268821 /ORGANISM="Scrippsiella Hangoei, Strain SHTV-5" /LENGTH=46 /DNA_ID= /DNA_START= /DNA_END= /DNA_ORIENTATION=
MFALAAGWVCEWTGTAPGAVHRSSSTLPPFIPRVSVAPAAVQSRGG